MFDVAFEMIADERAAAFTMATANSGLGEKDQAFAGMNKAYDVRDEGMVVFNVESLRQSSLRLRLAELERIGF